MFARRGEVLDKVIEYLHFKAKYSHSTDTDIPDFKNRIPPEIALELYVPSLCPSSSPYAW